MPLFLAVKVVLGYTRRNGNKNSISLGRALFKFSHKHLQPFHMGVLQGSAAHLSIYVCLFSQLVSQSSIR